jgi:hypothetical protein
MHENKTRSWIFQLLTTCLLIGCTSVYAGLVEAEKNYRKVMVTKPTAKFEESPFEGFYLMTLGDGGYILFDEKLQQLGFGDYWRSRRGEGELVENTPAESEVIRKSLLSKLKTDWLVQTGYNKGTKTIVLHSAPNCPSCRGLEQDLQKYSGQVGVKIVVLPTMLGKDTRFTRTVMCSSDPSKVWDDAISRRVFRQPLNEECQKSRWANVLALNLGDVDNNGRYVTRGVPLFLYEEGTIGESGWVPNMSLAGVRAALHAE